MKTQAAVDRWKEVVTQVGPDGKTGFERRADKIRAAKHAKAKTDPDYFKWIARKILDTLGQDGIKSRAVKQSQTKLSGKDPQLASAMKLYRSRVAYASRKQDLSDLPGFELWGKGFELDHMLSIHDAFKLQLPIDVVSHKADLRFISRAENRRKTNKSIVTVEQLMEKIG